MIFKFKWMTKEQVVDLFNTLSINILERLSLLESTKQIDLSEKINSLELSIKETNSKLETLIKEMTISTNNCDGIEWDSSLIKKEIKDNFVYYTLGVKGTTNTVQFKSDYESWTKNPLKFPFSGKVENVWYKVEGCEKEVWGAVEIPSKESNKVTFITSC